MVNKLVKTALFHGASDAAAAKVSQIPFREEFWAACEQNTCGKYNRCYMCPPDVGEIEGLIEKAKKYDNIFVFQTIGHLEDSFDIENMERAAKNHNRIMQELMTEFKGVLGDSLPLGAGACHVCSQCGKTVGEPCYHPEKAVASLEAYGISVSELATICGLKYINGPNTVTYFGAFLYHQ